MNISLRRVKMDASQTVFITSTGTVLFTCYLKRDQHGFWSTSVITSIDDQGSIVQVGHIKWNEHTESPPALCVRAGLMELRTVGHEDSYIATIFRGSDRRVYRWAEENGVVTLSADRESLAPVAIAYNDAQSFFAVHCAAESLILCIQPTGFHLLHEIIATFIVFERLRGRSPAVLDCDRTARVVGSRPPTGTRTLLGQPRIQLTKDSHWTSMEHAPSARLHGYQNSTGHHAPHLTTRYPTRSAADLTGELSRRYKYPSAYGGFGDIWKCDWLKDSRIIEVAVKVMRTNLMGSQGESEAKRIGRELKVWVRLEHECVLPLYGITFDFGPFPAMVCPWLEGGTLSRYLEHHEGLSVHTRLQLLSDVADGLQYLHVCGIVHGDLTGSNVLIKDNGKACLSDFGLSRIFMEATGSCYLSSTIRGSVRWAAPELFAVAEEEEEEESVHVLPTPQSDIYSFGSTMLQVLTGKVPYHYYKYDAQVLVALSRGLGPVRPDEPPIEDVCWEFMQRCWARQGKEGSGHLRPSIEDVVAFLSVARCRCGREVKSA